MKKIYVFVILVLLIIMMANSSYCYATTKTNWPTGGNAAGKVDSISKNIWATVVVVVQILAISAVVFTGLRYMFTSADGRANIKKELAYLLIGAILVFCTTTIINFIVEASKEIIK